MKLSSQFRLQIPVFSLVAAAFTSIYITQPVLPVLSAEFRVNETMASLTISMVVLGIALSNLPFGRIADLLPIRPIILTGGLVVTACGLICALTHNLYLLIAARFVQGLFFPALTTCLAAFLSRALPVERLNVVMGSYVAATVVGGLGGRLLGGWIHPPLHWRYAFASSAALLLAATAAGWLWLPREQGPRTREAEETGFLELLRRPELFRTYLVSFGAFFVFSSSFNYLPFHLQAAPFHLSTEMVTLLYLSYLVGVVMGPVAGGLSNRIGGGAAMVLGSVVFGLSLCLTLAPSLPLVVLGLLGVCAGFFTVHASAAGSLNRRLTASRGRANALYVLFYYLGGYTGITLSGQAYIMVGWPGVVGLGCATLLLPLTIGLWERRGEKSGVSPH